MRIFTIVILFASTLFISCGPENAAKEVCACYYEVYQLDDVSGTKKMNECMSLLEKHRATFTDTDDKNEFEKALRNCR